MIVFAQQGVLTGGWEYIWAAYGITWATFLLYAVYLTLRSRGRT